MSPLINVGINGFGRIGKALFIQILDNPDMCVKAINVPRFNMDHMEEYLRYDSTHKYNTDNWNFTRIDETTFSINGNKIKVFQSFDAKELNWKTYGIEYVFDATGVFLTKEKAGDHNVNHVVICAPPKDDTPIFVNNVNHKKYNGEKIVSNASCTTNCITPVLRFLNDKYGIRHSNFTTIHATTSTQTNVDGLNRKDRTHRSMMNNIIPHSTGASKAITKIIPSLAGKIAGTSLRVPTNNVSIVDLNVELESETTIEELMEHFENHDFIKVNKLNLVSGDFLTTKFPSIVDVGASMDLGNNTFKIMIWYDNEWSYTAQAIRLVTYMNTYNLSVLEQSQYQQEEKPQMDETHPCFIENLDLENKRVLLRVDWNVPVQDGKITDDFRIRSSLKTVDYILKQNPERLIIMSHFGRPEPIKHVSGGVKKDMRFSWFQLMSQIQNLVGSKTKIHLLPDGLSLNTLAVLNVISRDEKIITPVYLLENLRFHEQETEYKNMPDSKEENIIHQMGDVYINDAFGCCHRDHLSITGIQGIKQKGFGYLITQELNALQLLISPPRDQKVLAIIGGGKMDDKLKMVETMSMKMNDIYIAGGNINSLIKDDIGDYMARIWNNKATIHLMKDGICATDLNTNDANSIRCCSTDELQTDEFFFDIGMESMIQLKMLIDANDIIFWNGTLGVVENELFENGSRVLMNLLMNSGKKVIIGGGDTAGFVNSFPHKFHYVSTGGGAALEYISNGALCGVDFFNEK